MALSINELNAITSKYFIPKLYDNIFSANALLSRAKSKKWYKKIDGGSQIQVPLAYAQTSSSGWYSGDDTLTVTANEQMTAAVFDWAQSYASINISGEDELKNKGKSQIIDLVKSKVSLAEKTLRDKLSTGLFNDGTTAKAIAGFRAMVAAGNTYGGIDRTTNSWFDSNVTAVGGALTLAAMAAAYGDASVGDDAPTVIVTTQDIFDDYNALLQANQRFSDSKLADGGFQNLLYKGTPVIVDSHCPTGYMYFLNENYIELDVNSKRDFAFSGFTKPSAQDVKIGQIFWMGALTGSDPRMQAVLTGIV